MTTVKTTAKKQNTTKFRTKGPSRAYMAPSATVEWATPQAFFDAYNAEFRFTLDAAASAENHKCERFFTNAEDGLAQDWGQETVWVNPPYGRQITDWMKKAAEAQAGGATVVMLVPARTDTAWFHDVALKQEVRFLRGRLKFGGATHGAPFGCIVVVFSPFGTCSGPVAA